MRRTLVIAMAMAVAAGGCGGDDASDRTPATTSSSTTAASAPSTTAADTPTTNLAATSTTASTEPPTTTSTTTTTTTTTLPVTTHSWSRLPHDPGLFGGDGTQRMWSVTAGGPGLVAVGKDSRGGDDWVCAVWTSVDGFSWSRVAHDEAVLGSGEMYDVTTGGPGLVAVGEASTDAAVWTSVDGITWSRAPHDDAALGGAGAQTMRSVIAGGPGLVAVGGDWSGGNERAAVWTSVDGITWSRVPHDEEVFGGDGALGMWRVAAGGPGLVVVGLDSRGSHHEHGAVWTSVDGITWSRVPHDEDVFSGVADIEIWGVAAGGPGLVAVGADTSGARAAAVWTSVDGLTWLRVPHDEVNLDGDGNQIMWDVVAGGPGLVAVGWDTGGERDAAVWRSEDGLTWLRLRGEEALFGGPGTQAMLSVAVGGPGLVAVGGDWGGGDWDGAVWVEEG
jgi:hypothetical protein